MQTNLHVREFDAHVQQLAERTSLPLESFRTLILQAARMRPVLLDECKPELIRTDSYLRSQLVKMYQAIHSATLQIYPAGFSLAKDIDEKNIEKELGTDSASIHRIVVWGRPNRLRRSILNRKGGRGRIIGHVALEFLHDAEHHQDAFDELREQALSVLSENEQLNPANCVVIRDLYYDSSFAHKNNINSRGLVRRLLRRAIEIVEEGHGRFHKHWCLATCIPPNELERRRDYSTKDKLNKRKQRLEVLEQIIETEGGKRAATVECKPHDRTGTVHFNIWLFSQRFLGDPSKDVPLGKEEPQQLPTTGGSDEDDIPPNLDQDRPNKAK